AQDRSQYAQEHNLSAAFVDQRLTEPGLPPSMNDWGETGLIQNPSARTGLVGDFNITLSNVNPYTRYNFEIVPAPWLEVGFRYTAIM
ncbi:YjbH domain-containing protein, partial [Salmonella enterica]|uniref:YjbH domain-containing protein n=1 Tax=Salmonella enterica TaxID=28901 RepID=UPI003CF5A454